MKNIDSNKINWTVVCVNEFAKQKLLNAKDAFRYLYTFGGITFLKEHYEAEHLLSLGDAVDDLTNICQRNGGKL